MAQEWQPMQWVVSYRVRPVAGSLYRQPTGQAVTQGASGQWRQAMEMHTMSSPLSYWYTLR